MLTLAAFIFGYLLDLVFGDPHGFPHPVVGIGKLINGFERMLRRVFSEKRLFLAGVLLAVFVPLISAGIVWGILALAQRAHPVLRFLAESFLCYQILAVKSLRVESMKVYAQLDKGDLPAAREAVAMIVGRDTESLDAQGVAKAAVETVAENSGDGVVAPMLFLAVGGAPLGMLYKAVNTMDSMIGYKNDKYLLFGRAAAKLDDFVNFIPARLSGLLMIASAYMLGLNGKDAWRVFKRDRRNHASPNSAQTEAACAGALGVQLGGDGVYFGKTVKKPTIGDDTRPVEHEDIRRVNAMMYVTAALAMCVFIGLRIAVLLLFR